MKTYEPTDLEKWDNLAAKAAQEYAEYVYSEKLFEALSKDMLAALMNKLVLNKDSIAHREMVARASDEWRAFREEQMKVLKEGGKRRIKYDNAQRRWETARSLLSAKKKEMERIPS